jgi:tetratricopeptide (TPR) repeat protein
MSASEARELLRQGRLLEAERLFERVLESEPDDVEALNMVALGELRKGAAPRALSLLERAARAQPADALTQLNLGRAKDALGDLAGARSAYASAVQLRPEFFVARLHFAYALERSDQPSPALLQYGRALKEAQDQGRWVDPSTTPQSLRPLVERAVHIVRSGRHALFYGLLEPMVQRYGRESMARVERCLRVYLNEERAVSPDPRQAPTFLYFPDLPPAPYLDRALFPWIEALEAQTDAIRAELMQLLPSSAGRERVFTSEELERENLRSGLDVAPSWNGYYFYRHGERREDNCAACPATAAALAALPLARVREHGPEVLYSVFTPGTHLLPHKGVTNTRLVGHLPLLVPSDCALRVGGEIHEWQPGRVVVFDDTYEHEAWNRSRQRRVVMIFDIWNPYLTEPERAALAELVPAIGDFRKRMESA